MSPVTLGMIAGGLLVLIAIAVFLLKKELPAGGIAVTLIGFGLIGMSQWSTLKISVAGASLEAIKAQVQRLEASPRVDVSRLRAAREDLARVIQR